MKLSRSDFLVLFIFSLFINPLFAQEKTRMLEDIEKKIEREEVKEREKAIEIIVRPQVQYEAENLKDPFQPYIIKRPTGVKEGPFVAPRQEELPFEPPTLTVQGVIWKGNLTQAIINNKVVKVGDTIEGAQIIDISKDGIKLLYRNRMFTLSSPAAGGLEGLETIDKRGGSYEK